MIKIKAITLKSNLVSNDEYYTRSLKGVDSSLKLVAGDPMKYMPGLPILIDDVEYFVYDITFHSKASKFPDICGLDTGCYVIRFAAGSEDFCMDKIHNETLVIMEDVVATVFLQQ